jgi:hypothetical protein
MLLQLQLLLGKLVKDPDEPGKKKETSTELFDILYMARTKFYIFAIMPTE